MQCWLPRHLFLEFYWNGWNHFPPNVAIFIVFCRSLDSLLSLHPQHMRPCALPGCGHQPAFSCKPVVFILFWEVIKIPIAHHFLIHEMVLVFCFLIHFFSLSWACQSCGLCCLYIFNQSNQCWEVLQETQSDLFWNIYLFHMAFKATGLFLVLMLQKVDSNFFFLGGGVIHKAEAQERFRSKESLWDRNEQTVKESWKTCKKKIAEFRVSNTRLRLEAKLDFVWHWPWVFILCLYHVWTMWWNPGTSEW